MMDNLEQFSVDACRAKCTRGSWGYFLAAGLMMLGMNKGYAQLSWDSRQLDFHPKAEDVSVQGDFTFVNAGSFPITIKEVKTTCGCTTTALDKKTYAPGEKGKITTVFHVGERLGLQQKQVIVSTDNPEEPWTQLTVRAFIPEWLRIEPRAVVWRLNAESGTRTIKITTGTEQPVKVLGVKTSDDRIFAQLKPIEAGKSYEISVSANSTKEPLRAVVRVETDFPQNRPKVFSIPVEISAPFLSPTGQPNPYSFPAAPPGFSGQPAPGAAGTTSLLPPSLSRRGPSPPAPGTTEAGIPQGIRPPMPPRSSPATGSTDATAKPPQPGGVPEKGK